jgi:hypothetical protein
VVDREVLSDGEMIRLADDRVPLAATSGVDVIAAELTRGAVEPETLRAAR